MLAQCGHCGYAWSPRSTNYAVKNKGMLCCPMCHKHTKYDKAIIQDVQE